MSHQPDAPNYRNLPAGHYVLQAQVEDATGHIHKAERQITVLDRRRSSIYRAGAVERASGRPR
jgi:hypothetical protein